MRTVRHLVCGTDFSANAEQALAATVALAESVVPQASITVVHVCELGVELRDEVRLARAAEALAAVVERLQKSGVAATGLLRAGTPWEKLDNVAVEVGASLIVIGRHGAHRGLSVPVGSVAENLVRRAGRPVLTVASDHDLLAYDSAASPSSELNPGSGGNDRLSPTKNRDDVTTSRVEVHHVGHH